ncbi:intraflagellar transport protein 74 homolog isoform X2 [Anabrus simplex]|uniref:intraflagellar transport protein 74 homolog isoform X2 n=1 Tax=Anabrus simplex TaxID=316456 RepID=UPI0034DD2185
MERPIVSSLSPNHSTTSRSVSEDTGDSLRLEERSHPVKRDQQMEERPYTQHRPQTSGRASVARPPSAFSTRNPAMPGTASRLTSAMMQPPGSRAGTAMNLPGAQLNVVDRPITQQGLSGLKTGIRGPQMRQVQDKRYFEGLLQTKIRELGGEIGRLSKDIENLTREQSTYLVYDKRVKEMAAELTETQGQLADYNLVVDKLNTDTEKAEIDAECQELKNRNNEEASQIDQLFAQRQQKEEIIKQLEMEIEQERHMAQNLLEAMSPPLKERYSDLQHTSTQLQQQMEVLQQQLDSLTARKNSLEDQISVSQIKQEAVRLHHKLLDAEDKRAALIAEEKTRATPAQEREQLFQRVKEDNAEMATMDRQIAELKESIRKKQEELEQTEQDLEESQSERHQKYRELRRREETMEQFLASFEENKVQELARLEQLETNVVATLQQISKNLARTGNLPNVEDFSIMKDNLEFKEGELEKSKRTVDSLSREHQHLQANLQKVEALEEKIKAEMEALRQRMAVMTSEMGTLSDLDKLRDEAQQKRNLLDKKRMMLEAKRGPSVIALREEQTKFEMLKDQLNDNETYAQLSNLERKLAQLEQNNFAMKEFIESKKSETDYEPLKSKVYQMSQDYNSMLKIHMKRGGVTP